MAERNHWHVIPRTAPLCWLSMAAGVLLLVSSIVTLTMAAGAPVLEVIVAVLAVALMVLAGLGLARPELRGR
ncbi:hypothetical protein ACIA5G_11530 [Amycolatopsis sp. NPDC051758]|uniref:hypothetical protein n=1 Tax=Amycolatopsis sp. NPDC051758 TaxID=3363935 RepID=UPI00379EC90E